LVIKQIVKIERGHPISTSLISGGNNTKNGERMFWWPTSKDRKVTERDIQVFIQRNQCIYYFETSTEYSEKVISIFKEMIYKIQIQRNEYYQNKIKNKESSFWD
jgi:hypothetical protein